MSADQSSDPRFLVFDKPEAGIRALMRVLINWLFRDPEHCRKAHLKDIWLADRLISQTPSHLLGEAQQLFGREVG